MKPYSGTVQPVATDRFPLYGRGPVLRRAVWSEHGSYILAFEYYTGYPPDAAHLKHIRVVGPQVVMVTSEETINVLEWAAGFSEHLPAAALDLGRSEWLHFFCPRHLATCHHFQLLFYDEMFDIICEGLEFGDGGYDDKA